MDPTRWRQEFPILATANYLNSCSLGALSRRAEARDAEFRREWHALGASAWYEIWLGRLRELREQVTRLLDAPDDDVALAPSTSVALSALASSIDLRHRPRVVVSELDFPTTAYAWMARPGIELVRVPSDDGATIDLARWEAAIDDRTAVVATGHVFFATGAIQDLRALTDLAHRRGALCVVDGYHAAGQVPVSVAASGVDAYTCGPLKWLLGGPGLSYLYVRRELADSLTPTIAGWFGTEDQFDFDIGRWEPRAGARRFELGTPALSTVHTALGGQSIIAEVGVDRIRARNRALTERLTAGAHAAGFRLRIAPEPEARSAIVMIEHDEAAAAVAHLAGLDIIVDHRPGYVRVSPHFYNTEDEVDEVVAELRAWSRK